MIVSALGLVLLFGLHRSSCSTGRGDPDARPVSEYNQVGNAMPQAAEDRRQTVVGPQENAVESSLLPMLIGGLVLIVLAMVIVAIIV